jgi:dTDP-glucose 4,6-dehydratase
MSYGSQHITKQILSDLEEINQKSKSDLLELVNKPLVITGASGFVGTWLTLSWVSARKKLNGSGRLLLTSRNPQSLLQLTNAIDPESPISFLSSDIRNLVIPNDFLNGNLVHAATPASATLNSSDPALMLKIIVDGQERVLGEAIRTSNRVLFLSSGAVYGRQPLDLGQLTETWEGAPMISDGKSAYHEGKRVAELMGNIAYEKQGLHFVTARLFAFVAPFLPLRTHFAVGNFLRDAHTSNLIEIQSGGGSIRTYLYATDLCSSLWSLQTRGQSGRAYNVGADEEVSIRELAHQVAATTNRNAKVVVHGVDSQETLSRYVPSIERISNELGVAHSVALEQALMRTSTWMKEVGNENEW